MCLFRKTRSPLSRPDLRFVRTLQAPDHLVFNKASGLYEVSSQAFSASKGDGSLSEDLEELLVGDGLDARALYPAVSRAVGASAFPVEEAISLGLSVGHEPAHTNWYHGGVRGNLNKGNKKKLQRIAQELIPIDQDAARDYEEKKQAAVEARVAYAAMNY